MELHQQQRLLRQIGLRITVHRAHGIRVEQFNSSNADAELDDFDHRVNGVADARKLHRRSCNHLGNAEHLERDLADDTEGSLRTHEEVGEVITRRGLASAS
ncbi:MAG: hypothetical protein EBT21_05520 [Actinobacteria bacterium]|nr:hypothetical protein [Actinomycetota bacterium]